jgi:AcrR family transcriptional regulator
VAGVTSIRRKLPSPWPRRQQRDAGRDLKREAVLRVAVEFFNDKGFHATSLDDVADALNVTKPTIYHYFSSKDDILLACVRRGVESIRQAGAAVEERGGSGIERLKAHMRSYAIVMTSDFGMCVTRTADHELSKESRARFRALKRETDLTLRAVVEDGMRDGSIAPGDPRLVTFTLAGALNWIARWYDPRGSLSPQAIADGAVATLVDGLAPRTGGATSRASAPPSPTKNRRS